MTRDQAICKAREITGCEAAVVAANECQVWGPDGCHDGWDVLLWETEEDAQNDDGARAVARVRLTDDA